jgi:competence protein ComEC
MGARVAGTWPALADTYPRARAALRRLRDFVGRRPYHLGVGALAAGLALGPARHTTALVVAAASAAVLAVLRLKHVALLAAGLVCAGALAGALRVDAIDRAAARAGPAGTALDARVILLEHPRPSLFGSSAVVEIVSGRARGSRVLARLPGRQPWPEDGQPGAILRVTGSVAEPASGGSFDWRAYLRRRGIAFELALDSLRPTGTRRGGVLGVIDAMRGRAERALGTLLPASKAALARGMVLGEDEAIDSLERDDFRRAGLAHVLAVSGQNVMLLCVLALPLLGLLGAGPRVRIAVLLGLIAIYVPLAGAGASLQRAGVMGAAGLVALAAGRPASRWYALELAAVVTLMLNPRVAGDAGWQLSFAAVAGILLLARPLQQALRGIPRMLAEGAAVTLAATLATAPLIAHDFGSISLAGVVANVVALPLVAAIMWAGMLQCALAQLPHALGLAPAAIGLIGMLDGVLLGLLRAVVRTFAPGASANVVLPLGSRGAVALAYGLIGTAAVVIRRATRRVEPRANSTAAAWRRLPSRSRAAAVAVAGALIAGGWRYATDPPAPPGRLTVSFLDVGQGDATLIQDGSGAAALFDGGPPEARVYRLLRDAGVNHLDLMVATHRSRDHQGGLREVLDRIPTGTLLENGDGTRDPDFLALLADADRRGVHRVPARAGQVLRVGRLTIRILAPAPRPPGPPPENPNQRAVAAVVSEGAFDLFLAADAESPSLLPLAVPPVEALKVSHHGSADTGLPELLKRLQPQFAAIEVGAHNTYGHPAPVTLKQLAAAVPHVYRTDRDGTVTLSVDGSGRVDVSVAR